MSASADASGALGPGAGDAVTGIAKLVGPVDFPKPCGSAEASAGAGAGDAL